MKNIFGLVLVMTMTLATGCASLRKSSHTTQVRKGDSTSQVQTKGVTSTTIVQLIDTTVLVPADTLDYTLPYDCWTEDSAIDSTCIAVQDGTKVYNTKQIKTFEINTPTAKAKFTSANGRWHAQIILPQKSIPVKQTNYTQTNVDTTKTVNTTVQTQTESKQSHKEVKSGWGIYVWGIISAVGALLLIRFLIKKYL
jgi:hypothetical protein